MDELNAIIDKYITDANIQPSVSGNEIQLNIQDILDAFPYHLMITHA